MEPDVIDGVMKTQSLVPALLVAGGWAIRELIARKKKDAEDTKAALEKLDEALQQNTLAMTRLTVQMEYLNKAVESLPEIRKDVDALGAKFRKAAQPSPE
jgi:hypothetical protein